MVIGFKKQFVDQILNGEKIHTIRDDKGNRWKPGVKMHMYTGGRFSKEYKQFAEKTCISTQEIVMWLEEDSNGIDVLNMFLQFDKDFDFEKFAKRDGFENIKAFMSYWAPIIHDLPARKFTGKIIHWTNLKY